jgi:MerR family transcriptional regulator, light-induced transcriptional regulator
VTATAHGDGLLRIGELSRRVGITPDTLRAWERRYGLLKPQRTGGGFRLYSDADEARIRAMKGLLEQGLAPAQAAARALADETPAVLAVDADPIADLRRALEGFDESAAHEAIDRVMATLSIDSVLLHVVLPYLRDVGDRWARGEITVAQEHFACSVLRTRLLGRGRGWDSGTGPRAVLACAPEEVHDLPLICLGLALRERGWRITLLGADTPIETLIGAATVLMPDLCVVAAVFPVNLASRMTEIRRLSHVVTVVLAGPGATQATARACGAELVTGDPVSVADRLTREQLASLAQEAS